MPTVGQKGQVVIEKEIRDQLGIAAGWHTVQSLVGDHVEIRFIPPEHERSLFGVLSSYAGRAVPYDDDLERSIAAGTVAEFTAAGNNKR